MLSAIDIVTLVWRMLDVPSLKAALGGDYIWQHNWPRNSDKNEVCISIPTTDAYESKLKFLDIDIRTPNFGLHGKTEYYPYQGKPQDNTFPDLQKLKEITDIILPLIVTTGGLFVETVIPGVPKRDSDGNWIVNIRVQFTILDEQDSLPVRILLLEGVRDIYGGSTPTKTEVWEGAAQRLDIVKTPHLDKTAGKYGLHMRSSWLVPRDQVSPVKNMQLSTPEGDYIITGIFPEGIFWRLTTTRKDGPFV